MLRPSLLLLLCCCCAIGLRAQTLQFQHLTKEQGLPDNSILCVYEDRAGYIWVGTENGLARYDGQRVERFPAGSNGPQGARISAIAEDAAGNLWISTIGGGLSKRDPRTGLFTHYRQGPGAGQLPSDLLSHVLVVNDSTLVISAQDRGAFWFNPQRGDFTPKPMLHTRLGEHGSMPARPEEYWCHRTILMDPTQLLVLKMSSPTTLSVDPLSGAILQSPFTADSAIFISTNGTRIGNAFYLGGWAPGIRKVDLSGITAAHTLPVADEVNDLLPWDGGLLVGTKVNGLLLLDTTGATRVHMRHTRVDAASLSNDRVRCLLKDRQGNLWAGTANGLSVHAPATWRFTATPLVQHDAPGALVFHDLQQDPDGTIRIATSKGFVLVDPRTLATRTIPQTHNGMALEVTGLYRVPSGWYMGTETGLFRYDPVHERILTDNAVHYEAGSMFQVRSAFERDFRGKAHLFMGVLGWGQEVYATRTGSRIDDWEEQTDKRSANDLMVRSTVHDDRDRYWSATMNGVIRWEFPPQGGKARNTQWNTSGSGPQHLPGNDITGLIRRNDTVWVAMRETGAAAIVNDVATAYHPPSHMPNDLLGLTLDRSGHLWCTTSNGLLRYTPRSGTWLHVPINDGKSFRQTSGRILTLHDGRIALVADNHLITFDPTAFDNLPPVPVPTLLNVQGSWGSIGLNGDTLIDIPYRSSSFDASVSALRTTGAAALTFVYRLEGLDEVAHAIAPGELIRYAGVPVGTHRLLVRVRDAYGQEGPEHALLTVKVTGPFWQRWWFFLLLLGIGASVMYLIAQYRHRQQLRVQRIRDGIARDLHDDIGSALGSISFYSETLKRKLEHNDGTAGMVADKIGSSSRAMIEQMSDIVWSVDPKNDDTGSLAERMEAFAADLLATKSIALHFDASAAPPERKLSATQRRNLFLIHKEALHNALKYAACSAISVRVGLSGKNIELEVVDNGIGFDPENVDSYNGHGLGNMQARAASIGGVLTIDSRIGQGTRIHVAAPLSGASTRSGD